MKDLGAAQSYLGIQITRDRAHQCIWIDQEAYIDSALSRFHLMDANDTKTPLPAGVHLTKSENKDDRHSTLGQVFTLANGVISWASQRQKMVALSVGESEYMELAATGHQCTWLRSFSVEIGFPFTQATTICADNQAVIFLAINPAVEWRMKHIDICHHYIHEQVETKVIDLYHITGEENPADLFTKP